MAHLAEPLHHVISGVPESKGGSVIISNLRRRVRSLVWMRCAGIALTCLFTLNTTGKKLLKPAICLFSVSCLSLVPLLSSFTCIRFHSKLKHVHITFFNGIVRSAFYPYFLCWFCLLFYSRPQQTRIHLLDLFFAVLYCFKSTFHIHTMFVVLCACCWLTSFYYSFYIFLFSLHVLIFVCYYFTVFWVILF